MILSIVVPVYKVERYIHQCIDSLVCQLASNTELILVDDGSPDNSGSICDEYAKKYENVIVIHKENGGLVSARKSGFLHSSGEYITFVDSDDWVEPDYVNRLIEIIEHYAPDVVATTAFFRNTTEQDSYVVKNEKFQGLYNRESLEANVYASALYSPPYFSFGVFPSLCMKVIKHELISEYILDIPEVIRMGEDLAVSLPCVLDAQSIYFADVCGYHYRQNIASMSYFYDKNAPSRVMALLDSINNNIDCHGLRNIDDQLGVYSVYMTQNALVSLLLGSTDIRRDLQEMKSLFAHKLFKAGIKMKIPFKTKLMIRMAMAKQVWFLKILKRRFGNQ